MRTNHKAGLLYLPDEKIKTKPEPEPLDCNFKGKYFLIHYSSLIDIINASSQDGCAAIQILPQCICSTLFVDEDHQSKSREDSANFVLKQESNIIVHFYRMNNTTCFSLVWITCDLENP